MLDQQKRTQRRANGKMKVQIFEPFVGAHHTKYLRTLLPSLVCLQRTGSVGDIVVTISQEHRTSDSFTDQLVRFEGPVAFDPAVPRLGSTRGGPGYTVTGALLRAVARCRPDFLVCTSANQGAATLALTARLHPAPWRRMWSIAVLHNGFPNGVRGMDEFVRDGIHRFSRANAPFDELMFVNPLLFQTVAAQLRRSKRRVSLLPDPVDRREPVERGLARASLLMPVGGRYVGCVGRTDARKRIPELLAAFRETSRGPMERLLLAGRLWASHRSLIERQYSDLLRSERLLLIDRYLAECEMDAAYGACDAVVVAQYPTSELSGSLLAAIAAGKPVIADRNG